MKPYHTAIINGAPADVYDILTAFGVTCPAKAHAIKKLLRCGRGHKTALQDLQEAQHSVSRALALAKTPSVTTRGSNCPVPPHISEARRHAIKSAIDGVKRSAVLKAFAMKGPTLSSILTGSRPVTDHHWRLATDGCRQLRLKLTN